MPSHALKEPFTRTSEDRVTMLHSMLLIIFLWITRKQALSVYVALLVSSSILSDIHHGIRISLSMRVVTVIGGFYRFLLCKA